MYSDIGRSMGSERESKEGNPEDSLNGVRIQLQPYRTSWHHSKDTERNGMCIQRYVVEKYIPAPGFYFVFKEDDSVYHLPIDSSGTAGGS